MEKVALMAGAAALGLELLNSKQPARERAKPQITRYKGLGEISPKEFAQFIGKEMRLSKVECAPRAGFGPILNFHMGKNAPACVNG